MKNKKSFIIVFCFLVVIFFLINYSPSNPSLENVINIKIGEETVVAELAKTSKEQMQGLSGRKSLLSNEGMLFVFSKPGTYYFWMKDMNFPIDIIWIAEDKSIVYIKKEAKPENFLETYGSDVNAKYVLEVVSGFSDKNNLKIGDMVEFSSY